MITIIASLISAAGTIGGVVLTNRLQLRRQTREIKQHVTDTASPKDADTQAKGATDADRV
jgi:hypothetical protein